jgi:DNA-binding response OmpR family regulator
MHVLLVEDNALVASGVKAGLQLQGFGVDVVGCASQADAALKSSHFDVCVLIWVCLMRTVCICWRGGAGRAGAAGAGADRT